MSLRAAGPSKEKPVGLPTLNDILLAKPLHSSENLSYREQIRRDMNPNFFKPMQVSKNPLKYLQIGLNACRLLCISIVRSSDQPYVGT